MLFISDSELNYSMILAAKTAHQKVLVNHDDEVVTNDYCRAIYVTADEPLSEF